MSGGAERAVRVGLTLPSFVDDPETPLAVGQAAEDAGLDAVFVFDHLFRTGKTANLRPALECTALLGAVAARTRRIAIGTLVARATLRPPATLGAALDTVQRIAGPRVLAGLGAGDIESRAEMETFGFDFGTEADRVRALRSTLRVLRDRGYPVWVGGRARHVGVVAAEGADGWNRWGASVETFGREITEVLGLVERLARAPSVFVPSWGGLVLLGETEADAEKKRAAREPGPEVIVGGPEQVAGRLLPYAEAGARWLILGPVDSSDPDNAAIIGERVLPLLP
jgi:alkanesulfonate monooxygenase SsuD/methylene tetrahydromethanopterin reductase-like flavin-dependent oxidoreductase (luciferase family)